MLYVELSEETARMVRDALDDAGEEELAVMVHNAIRFAVRVSRQLPVDDDE